MGQETKCKVHIGKRATVEKALLESDRIIFHGEIRLDIPFKDVAKVEPGANRLNIKHTKGSLSFELGPLAPKWAARIRNSKTLLPKLGIKAGATVSLYGVSDPDFKTKLKERTSAISENQAARSSDIILIQADTKSELSNLRLLREVMKNNGAIWLITPKGVEHIKESDALQAGKNADLVDVKVVSFSVTHTAHKFVIPASKR